MSIEVTMPKFGATMEVGRIDKWLVKEGDSVKKGMPIAEISTEKITNTCNAPADGIIEKILVPEDESADVGALIALIK